MKMFRTRWRWWLQHCGRAKYPKIVHFQNDEFYVIWIWPQFLNIKKKKNPSVSPGFKKRKNTHTICGTSIWGEKKNRWAVMGQHRRLNTAQCAFVPRPQDRRKLELTFPKGCVCVLCRRAHLLGLSWGARTKLKQKNRFLEIYSLDL